MKLIFKIVIKCIALLLIFSSIFSSLTNYLRRFDDESNEIHAFYNEPKNSIDILFMGSSPMLRDISPMTLWNEKGYASYVRASALQAPSVTYYLLAEALQYQKPELVVLLCDNIFLEFDYVNQEGDLRRALDGMKISKYKLALANKIVKEDERQTILSYMFPLFRYHDRWKEVDLATAEPNFLLENSFKKGNVYLNNATPLEYPENFMEESNDTPFVFNDESVDYIKKSINLCKENNIKVLILHLPKMDWSYDRSMALEEFANEMNVDYLDLDRSEHRNNLNLDTATDYYDKGHMNLSGNMKVTKYLGNYLDIKYSLPNRKNNDQYNSWNENYEIFLEDIKNYNY